MTNGPITEPRPASSTPATSMGESLFALCYLNFKVIMLYLLYGFAYGEGNVWQQHKKSRTDGRAMGYRGKS
jgi:hypothetical protein